MKKLIQIQIITLISISSYSQVLLEDKTGDQIANNFSMFGTNGISNLALIKINSSDQTLGFNYFISNANSDPSNYKIHEFSVKAKPTEGYAAVFSNGQFSPGVKLGYSYTKVPLLADKNDYTDWLTINTGYDISKYLLYKKDTVFKEQVYNQNFKGFNLSFNYNALIKSKYILSLKAGYVRSNNYDDLKSLEVKDIISFFDTASSTQRQTIKTKAAKEGKFEDFDTYPLVISFTRTTQTDVIGSAAASKLRIGYTIYLKTIASKELPKTTAGLIFFLTKQDKSGVRSPVFGINLQATDPFDVQDKNNGLLNRIGIGFTSVFTL